MRFLSIYKPGRDSTGQPTQQDIEKLGALIEEMTKNGSLVTTEGCLSSAAGARIRIDGPKYTVTDGPFAEAKEIIGGFAILQAKSKQEAVELTKTFLKVMGEGECELRQLYEPGDVPHCKE